MQSSEEFSNQLAQLLTEQRNPVSREIDLQSTDSILRIINSEDKQETAVHQIASIIESAHCEIGREAVLL